MEPNHTEAFAAFRARREAARAAEVKVTWRKISEMTRGGWSALGPNGALRWVARETSGYAYGDYVDGERRTEGYAATLARAKATVELMFGDHLHSTNEGPIVRAVNNVPTPMTGGTKMSSTKITGLTTLQVRALNETMPGVATTSTTATFNLDAKAALADVEAVMADLPAKGHPRQSLHAVVRKLRGLAAVVQAPPGPSEEVIQEAVEKFQAELNDPRVQAGLAEALDLNDKKEEAVPTKTKPEPKPETPDFTAEQFAGSLEGVEAVRAAKTPTARLRANGKTLAYADDRKGGFNLSIAAAAIEGAPKKVTELVDVKGKRATLLVTAANAKAGATVVNWLAKQVA